MPRSKHRRKPGAKAVRHPGAGPKPGLVVPPGVIERAIHRRRVRDIALDLAPLLDVGDEGDAPLLILPDRRVVDASTADEWLALLRERLAARPCFDPVVARDREDTARLILAAQLGLIEKGLLPAGATLVDE